MRADEINSLESEAGIIATLIHHPEFVFHSETLLPNHFTNKENQCIYAAISDLAKKGIYKIDSYNIMEDLNSNEVTRKFAEELTLDKLNELIDMSDVLSRGSVEEYKLLVSNVMDAAFRRDACLKLKECEMLCFDRSQSNIEQKIYEMIDDVMLEFSTTEEVPQLKDVIDDYWEEIKLRQNGQVGATFKFPTLNEYATIEPGELFIFAGGAKQGKSMMLLNCAVDLLKKDMSVLYIDTELSSRLFTARILSHLTGIEYKRLTNGFYNEAEAETITKAMAWLKTKKLTHKYIPTMNQQEIYTTIQKVYHTQGIDVIIFDYFKGINAENAWAGYAMLGEIVDFIKNDVCGRMNICGIGAAQTTSTGQIADSAKIGRNASTIALIEEKTLEEIEADGIECGNKKLRVILNRNGMQHAPGEYISLRFNGNLISYEEAKQAIPQMPY